MGRRFIGCHPLSPYTTTLLGDRARCVSRGPSPNQITQSLIAVLAGLRVPFICTETHEMGEEILASYLYQVHPYQWLEENGFGSALTDSGL